MKCSEIRAINSINTKISEVISTELKYFIMVLENDVLSIELCENHKITFRNEIKFDKSKNLTNISITHLSHYLVELSQNSISYYNIYSAELILKCKWESSSIISQLFSVSLTDDILFIESSNNSKQSSKIVYAELLNGLILAYYKTYLYSREVTSYRSILCFNSDHYVLNVYNTNDIKVKKSFDKNSRITCNALAINTFISSDEKFMGTVKKTEVMLFRLSDGIMVANLTLHRDVRNLTITDKFLVVILSNNELLSFIIASKDSNLEKLEFKNKSYVHFRILI